MLWKIFFNAKVKNTGFDFAQPALGKNEGFDFAQPALEKNEGFDFAQPACI